ncbi:MAG: tetratricopeptide repeat protein [Planctomycetota bacterium]|jgi:tetratricopeptide (TPR) repeat protein
MRTLLSIAAVLVLLSFTVGCDKGRPMLAPPTGEKAVQVGTEKFQEHRAKIRGMHLALTGAAMAMHRCPRTVEEIEKPDPILAGLRLQAEELLGSDTIKRTRTEAAVADAETLIYEGKIEEAIAKMDDLIERKPTTAAAYVVRCDGYLLRNAEDDAKRALLDAEKAVSLAGSDFEPRIILGMAFVRMGNAREALKSLNKAVFLRRESPVAYCNPSIAKRMLGDVKGAMEDLEKALEADPGFSPAHINLGGAHEELGTKNLSMFDYSRAVLMDPGFPQAFIARGNLHLTKASPDLDAALKDMETAVELGPRYAYAYCYRGLVHDAAGQTETALADYDKSIEIDPGVARAWFSRGVIKTETGDHAGAESDFTGAIKADSDYVSAWVARAEVRQSLGKFEEAIYDLQKGLERAPEDWEHLDRVKQKIIYLRNQLK